MKTPPAHVAPLASRPRSYLRALAALSFAAAAALPTACASDPGPAAGATEEAVIRPPTHPTPPRTTCAVSTSGTKQTLTLDTVTVCTTALCPMNTLAQPAIHVTATADSSAQTSSTTWSVGAAGTTYMSATVSVARNVTTSQYLYGASISGATSGTFRNDGTTYSGTIDGRAITPYRVSAATAGPPKFADGKPAPAVTGNPIYLANVVAMLTEVGIDAESACGTSAPLVVARAKAAVWANLTSASMPTPGGAPALGGTVPTPALAHATAGAVVPDSTPPVGNGVSSGMGAGATTKNSPVDFETPGCTQCASDCGTDVLSWISGGIYIPFCEAGCFIPGHGCNEDSQLCDHNQARCEDLCCGTSQVCGNSAYGSCCPSDHPIGCGDATKVECFLPGSTCCGIGAEACGPGEVCIGGGAAATCCPAGQVDKNGACCDKGTICNGSCCTGSCTNGTCCFGPVTPSGQCCGIDQTVVNGACCSEACGSACCGAGQTCVNATASQCGAPGNSCTAGKVTCTYGNTSYCCDPDEQCNGSIAGCCGGKNSTNNCGIK